MDKLITVVIPTYNERDNITPLVEKINGALSGYNHEVLFIDDNSKDGTAQLISALSAKYPVQVIVRLKERGLASAVVHGFKYAKGEIVAVMDADLQHPPQVLADLLKAVDVGADLVIASRYVKGGGCEGWGLVRRIISKGAIFLAHLFLPQTRRISDPMSGFFMLRREVIDGADLRPTGYKILLEILMEGHYQKVAEVPYTFRVRERGKSKLSARQQIDYLKHLYSLMRRTGELVRFLKFCLVGASGVLVNQGLLWLLTQDVGLRSGLRLSLPSAIAIECSILSNFTLNDFFTFPDRRLQGWKSFLMRLGRFNMVSLPGLAINMGILLLLTNQFGGEEYYLLFMFNLCGIAVAMLWNYLVNSWWTWK
jgi:dolichol-phosphate mannosyltransferase